MTDAPNQDQRFEDIEGEVRAMLKDAESLTADLAAEIGDSPSTPSAREAEFFESETDSEASLDLQMSQADAALEATSTEMGTDPPPADPPSAPPAAATPKKITLPPRARSSGQPNPPEGATKEQGGTRPAGAPLKLPDRHDASAAQPAGDVKGTAVLPNDSESAPVLTGSGERTEELVAGRVEELPYPLEGAVRPRLAALGARLGANKLRLVVGPVGDAVCRALEWFDRPFARVNYRVRWLLGWLALVLAVAAVGLLFFAVL